MIVLRCNCGLPWAEVQNGCLVVLSRHRGQQHVNVITLEELRRLLERSQAEKKEQLIITEDKG